LGNAVSVRAGTMAVYNAKMTVTKFRRWGAVYWIVLALILVSCAIEDFGAGPNWSATFCLVRPP
jgi:hypothetical protein